MQRIILPLLLMLFTLTGCSIDNANIMNREKIVIGFDESFAPMGFRNDKGEVVGFDVDLAKEAARRLGVKAEFKPIDWTKKKEEITSGNVDMLWNGCDITPERKEYMIFSKPYMDNRQILVVKRGNTQNIYSIGCKPARVQRFISTKTSRIISLSSRFATVFKKVSRL